MLNKYISMNPIPWLTDGKNPAVKYLVKNEILKNEDSEQIYNDLINSDLTQYFYKNISKGVLGDFRHPDVFYRGSVWFFLLAVESGYKSSTEFVDSTSDYLCKKIQVADGGFKIGYKSSEAVGCRSGNMIFSLLKSGISDERTKNGINWIIKNQRNDGGWLHCPVAGFCDVMKLVFFNQSGNGLKYEHDNNISSCPVASYNCLKALIESGNNYKNESIIKGADFFIKNNYFLKTEKKLQCGNNTNFEKIGYPVMSQYDYLSGLILISKIENKNSNNNELFNSIIKKQNIDGTWNCENRLNGMIKERYGKSRWTTLNVLRLLKIISDQENQLENA